MLFFPYPVRVPYSVLTYIFAIALANELARSVWLIDGMRGSRNAACDAEISLEKLGTGVTILLLLLLQIPFRIGLRRPHTVHPTRRPWGRQTRVSYPLTWPPRNAAFYRRKTQKLFLFSSSKQSAH